MTTYRYESGQLEAVLLQYSKGKCSQKAAADALGISQPRFSQLWAAHKDILTKPAKRSKKGGRK